MYLQLMKKLMLIPVLLLALYSCSFVDDATKLSEDAQDSYDNLRKKTDEVVEDVQNAKDKVEETVGDIQNAAEKVNEAKEAVKKITE